MLRCRHAPRSVRRQGETIAMERYEEGRALLRRADAAQGGRPDA